MNILFLVHTADPPRLRAACTTSVTEIVTLSLTAQRPRQAVHPLSCGRTTGQNAPSTLSTAPLTTRIVADEEMNRCGHLADLGDAAERDAGPVGALQNLQLIGVGMEDPGQRRPREDGVDADSVVPVADGEGPREVDDPGFGQPYVRSTGSGVTAPPARRC